MQPSLQTPRLVLRAFTREDAPEVQRLAGAWEVADTTLLVPHPYEDGMAENWIASHARQWERQEGATFAVVIRESGILCGAIGLRIDGPFLRGELGYWIGRSHWGCGYCTEGAEEMLRLAFRQFELNRVFALCFKRNQASARVLRKLGMEHEGCLRQHVRRWKHYEDVECYGILRADWEYARYAKEHEQTGVENPPLAKD